LPNFMGNTAGFRDLFLPNLRVLCSLGILF
jgi:hypothetical protein